MAQENSSDFITHIFADESKEYKSYRTLAIEALKTGIVKDSEHDLNSTIVTTQFYHATNENVSVELELNIDWIESRDGFNFELTPTKAIYWDGQELKGEDLYMSEHIELAAIVKKRALAGIVDEDTLSKTKIDLEETATYRY